jgi:hypothetical protein
VKLLPGLSGQAGGADCRGVVDLADAYDLAAAAGELLSDAQRPTGRASRLTSDPGTGARDPPFGADIGLGSISAGPAQIQMIWRAGPLVARYWR